MTLAPTRPRHPALAALLNLAGQLLLLTAIPLALWKLHGNPIPKQIPSWQEIQFQWRGIEAQPSQLLSPVLTVLADLLWIVWAWYALRTALALIWVLIRLPGAIVTGTLGTITPALAFRALSLGALAAHPATPVHSAATATAPATPTPIHPAATGARTPTTGTASTVDVVEPGDNLWNLAEHYYHQGEDWHEIYDANKGAEQPDGRSLQDPDLIQPGWHLTIPAPVPSANGTAPAAPPAPPHGPATARPAPTPAPGRPAPAPAPTGPHTAPVRHPGGVLTPVANRPHTVGHTLPDDAGYIGITLITSIAAAVTILRTRNRRRGRPKNDGVPDLAEHIAAVHSLARSAQEYGFDPEDHPGMSTPPLYEPLDKQVTIATSRDSRYETPLNPETRPGPLLLHGAGAEDAARALAISTVATGHTLEIDPELSTRLLGTPSPAQPENPLPGTTSIRPATTSAGYERDGLIVTTPDDEHADIPAAALEVERGGAVSQATGPGADRYTGTRLHILAPEPAATIHQTLHDAQPGTATVPEQPSVNTETPAPTATERYEQPEQGLDLRALTSAPVTVQLLGEVAVHGTATTDPAHLTAERPAALLTLLALHPDGTSPRTLHETEWRDAPDERRARTSLNTTINRVRAPLRAALGDGTSEANLLYLDKATGNYRLNPQYVTSDLAIARGLVAQADTATDPDTQTRLLIQATALYRGPLAPRIDDRDRDWLTTARYTVLREATTLHLRIADLTAPNDAGTAADHLTTAVELAPDDDQVVITALRTCRRISRPDLARTLHRRHAEVLRSLGETTDPEADRLVQE